MKNPTTLLAACAAVIAVSLSAPAFAEVVSKSANEARLSVSSLIASAQTKIGQKNLKAALPDLMKAMDIEPANVGLQRCAATVMIAIDDEAEGKPGQMGSYCSSRLR
jgi:hypothetical protein